MMDEAFKREILLDHYSHPHNKGLKEEAGYQSVHMASESCIDDLTIQMLIADDMIKDIRFDGNGCTISTASTSIFTELLKDKDVHAALDLIHEYYGMLEGESFDPEDMAEANAFDTLHKQPNRINCGTIGIKAMEQLINTYLENK